MAAPVRGTQSFVGVMGQVWSRPSLSAMEIAWRWLPFVVPQLILLGLERMLGLGVFIPATTRQSLAAVQGISVFQPVVAVEVLRQAATTFLPSFRGMLGVLLLWNLVAAFGRTLVLRRLDNTLHVRRIALFSLGVVRSLLLGAAWWLWFKGLAYAANVSITAPAARGEEAHLVLFSAMLICGTLFLYVAWGVFSWFLQLAPLLAMRNNLGPIAALRAALGSSKELRSKLIEINLVMNIVRIALIVLAMVLSASPLAFQTVATQQFFVIWWCIAILLYLAASDYFHVVRSAAYLSLHRTLTSGQ